MTSPATYKIRMMLVDLVDPSIGRKHGYFGVSLEFLPDFLSQKRVLAQLRGNDHSSTLERLRGWLSLCGIRVDELFGIGLWIQILILDKMCRFR